MQKKQITFLMISLCAFTLSASAQSWSLTGNSGTNSTTNFLGTKDNQPLVFRTNNLERVRITNKGFTGIGTSKPQALFHLPSNGNVTLSKTDNFLIGDTISYNLAFDYNKIQARNHGSANTLHLNPKGGAVAIGNQSGTTNPGIYVETNGAVGVRGQYTQPGYALTLNPGFTDNGLYLYHPGDGYLLYGSKIGNGTAMYMENKSSNNSAPVIWAATEGPGTSIYGFSRGGTNSAGVAGYTDGGANAAGIWGGSSGSGNGIYGTAYNGVGVNVHSENNYGIYAATTNATYAGYFNRSIFVNGSVYTSSDQKLKQNIQNFTSAMDIINRLQPKKYEYRQDGSYKLMMLPEGVHYGLIAQDVEKVLPNLVKNTKFDPALETVNNNKPANKGNNTTQQVTKSEAIDFKAVNYMELVPILIKGMQEQQEKIEQLTRQVNELTQSNLQSTSSATQITNLGSMSAFIQQNVPNPFSQSTLINYFVPQNAGSAVINITDMNGKLIKTFAAEKGKNSIVMESNGLASGTYNYTLIVNGKRIDTKKMVVQK